MYNCIVIKLIIFQRIIGINMLSINWIGILVCNKSWANLIKKKIPWDRRYGLIALEGSKEICPHESL